MAHFAQLDENNIVTQVVVVANNDVKDANGNESEEIGIAFCKSLFGADTNWRQTSYNNSFRKNYASIGDTYRADIDAFVAPQPYPSWTLNEKARWEPPVPLPDDHAVMGQQGKFYKWNEETLSWYLLEVFPL